MNTPLKCGKKYKLNKVEEIKKYIYSLKLI